MEFPTQYESLEEYARNNNSVDDYTHTFKSEEGTITFDVSNDLNVFSKILEIHDAEDCNGDVYEKMDANTIPIFAILRSIEEKDLLTITNYIRSSIGLHFDIGSDTFKLDAIVVYGDITYIYMPYLKVDTMRLATDVISNIVGTVGQHLPHITNPEELFIRNIYSDNYMLNPKGKLIQISRDEGVVDDDDVAMKFPSVAILVSNILNKSPLCKQKKLSEKDKSRVSLSKRLNEEALTKKQSDLQSIREMQHLLSEERKTKEFRNIGQCLYNISKGSDEGFKIFTSICHTIDTHILEDLWRKYIQTGSTLGTFRFWCKNDNIDGYKKWRESNVVSLLSKCISPIGGDSDIVELMQLLFSDTYLCSDFEKKKWYRYEDNRYRLSNGGADLELQIETAIIPLFETHIKTINSVIAEENDEIEKKRLSDMIESSRGLIKRLKGAGKAQLMREASLKFYNSEFNDKMNSNMNLMSFRNGVFDADTGDFRMGTPQDYITLSTGYNFRHDYSWDTPEVNKCIDYISTLFARRDELEYTLYIHAGFLRGGNVNKRIICYNGSGNNGKSGLVYLNNLAFNQYASNPPVGLILQSKDNNPHGHTAGDETVKDTYVAFFSEIKKDVVLDDGKVKSMSNGCLETRASRGLGQEFKQIRSTATPVIMSNILPKFDSTDPAMVNRIVVLEFLSIFVSKEIYDKTSPEERIARRMYLADPNFKEYIRDLRDAYIWILVDYYRKYYMNNKVPPCPDTFTAAKDQYIRDNDTVSSFINDKLIYPEIKPDATAEDIRQERDKYRCTADDMYKAFQEWYRSYFPTTKVPTRADLWKMLQSKAINKENNVFKGISVRR